MSNCLRGNASWCVICLPGYLVLRLTSTTNICSPGCPDRAFPYLVYNATNPGDLNLAVAGCMACMPICKTCIDGNSCTSCKEGYYLYITDPLIKVGNCLPKVNILALIFFRSPLLSI